MLHQQDRCQQSKIGKAEWEREKIDLKQHKVQEKELREKMS
jgi:hypothetical protein